MSIISIFKNYEVCFLLSEPRTSILLICIYNFNIHQGQNYPINRSVILLFKTLARIDHHFGKCFQQ